MKSEVWIINPYGNLPSEAWVTYRSTMLAEALAGNGFSVTQFISNFDHRSKSFRSSESMTLKINENYTITIIPSTAYHTHISFARIAYERNFARNLVKRHLSDERPAVIVLAEPALFYYDILLKSSIVKNGTKLVLDIIDIWPELFKLAFPKALRPISNIFLSPLYYWRRRLYKQADAVVAVSQDYLSLARKLVDRKIPFEVVYWSYPARLDRLKKSPHERIDELIQQKEKNEVWIIYSGTLGENYDIFSIIRAANELKENLTPEHAFKFLIAGDGPLKGYCQRMENEQIIFVGRLSPEELKSLYDHCDIALSTYKGESTVAMPIKAFDYLYYGLPIINSLGKDLGELIRNNEIGTNYDPYNPASLRDAIQNLMLNRELRERYARNARSLAKNFSSEIQYRKFVNLIKGLC